MLLSEGQMSDFKGAALMIGAFPKAKALLGDKGYDADWFRDDLADQASPPASHQKPIAKSISHMTRRSTASDTRSRTCSENSKTGAASTHDTTAAPTPSYLQSASRQLSSSG